MDFFSVTIYYFGRYEIIKLCGVALVEVSETAVPIILALAEVVNDKYV